MSYNNSFQLVTSTKICTVWCLMTIQEVTEGDYLVSLLSFSFMEQEVLICLVSSSG